MRAHAPRLRTVAPAFRRWRDRVGDPVATKTLLDVHRSSGGFGKVLFSAAVLLGVTASLIDLAGQITGVSPSVGISFGAILGLPGSRPTTGSPSPTTSTRTSSTRCQSRTSSRRSSGRSSCSARSSAWHSTPSRSPGGAARCSKRWSAPSCSLASPSTSSGRRCTSPASPERVPLRHRPVRRVRARDGPAAGSHPRDQLRARASLRGPARGAGRWRYRPRARGRGPLSPVAGEVAGPIPGAVTSGSGQNIVTAPPTRAMVTRSRPRLPTNVAAANRA